MTDTPTTSSIFQDWQKWGNAEPFEDLAGPFFYKWDAAKSKHIAGFLGAPQHMNGGGYLHGGMLMTFADYALFIIAHDALNEQNAVTVACQTEFLKGAAPLGQPVYAEGEVTRNTRSLIFIRGRIYVEEDAESKTLATFSGILKKVGQ